MTFLCILFIPPLYLLSRKKWGAFLLNSMLYGIALLCLVSIVGIPAAPLFWILAVGHAVSHRRRETMAEHADLIATKMAAKLKQG